MGRRFCFRVKAGVKECRRRAEFRSGQTECNNISAMKPNAQPTTAKKPPAKRQLKSGLPGTPEQQRRELRAAMKKHDETLRRLAE